MFLRDSIKTACPSLHIEWPRKEREANSFFGCCNYTAWSSQAVYLPAGDVTAPSARKLHSSTLKSRFIIHELQNLKGAIKVFSNNNKKRNNCYSLNYGGFGSVFSIFTWKKNQLNQKKWHGPDVTVHYRRFLSLPSIKLSWPSAVPSSGQGRFLLLLPHHTHNRASVAKAGGSCSQPLQSSQPHSVLASGGPKQGRAQRHPFYLSSLTAPFCTSHINGSLWVQPTGRKILQWSSEKTTLTVFSAPYSFSSYK